MSWISNRPSSIPPSSIAGVMTAIKFGSSLSPPNSDSRARNSPKTSPTAGTGDTGVVGRVSGLTSRSNK
jgi:hypothetical protein